MTLLIVLVALATLACVVALGLFVADFFGNVIDKLYSRLKGWQVGLLNWFLMSLGWFLIVAFFVAVNR